MTSAPLPDRLAAAFANHGTKVAFGVPGGGPNLELIEALGRVGVRFVLAHTETAACIMASTHGFLTGDVSPAIVTRGPGAASATNGAAQATLDRYPLALVTDTVPSQHSERIPHQRLHQPGMLTPVTKASTTVGPASSVDGLGELLEFARQAPQGTVHLDYDNTATTTQIEDPPPAEAVYPTHNITSRIRESQRPVVICGIGAAECGPELRESLIEFAAPTFTTYQAIGVIPTEHHLCAGLFTNGATESALLDEADLIVTVGLDPVEPIPTRWTYAAPVISFATHATTDPYLPIDSELIGDLEAICATHLVGSHGWPADRGDVHRTSVRATMTTDETHFGAMSLVTTAIEHLDEPMTVTVDAGAHFLAIMPMWPVESPKRLLISNGLATMGFAVPAAIGAAIARPGEPVMALVGDGGLGMTLAELETIARLDLPITVVVFNDSALSLIKIKQSADGSGGENAVRYRETDFSAIAKAMGLPGQVATNSAELAEHLSNQSEGPGGPALIDARIDPGDYAHLLAVTRG